MSNTRRLCSSPHDYNKITLIFKICKVPIKSKKLWFTGTFCYGLKTVIFCYAV